MVLARCTSGEVSMANLFEGLRAAFLWQEFSNDRVAIFRSFAQVSMEVRIAMVTVACDRDSGCSCSFEAYLNRSIGFVRIDDHTRLSIVVGIDGVDGIHGFLHEVDRSV